MSALAQQGGHSSGWFWTNQKGSCLARSERTHKPWEGEGERKKCHYSLPCTCTHTHLSHLHTLTVSACIYRCIYRTLTHSLSQKDMNTHTERHSNPKNEGSSGCCWEAWGIYLSPMTMKYRNTHAFNISSHSPSSCTHTHTHTRPPSPLRPASLDPTDSLQSALEPRGSSLPLEPVSDTVIWHWQWQW